jgi:outer membrane protein OmpA-like peptidoglycan-associated protein
MRSYLYTSIIFFWFLTISSAVSYGQSSTDPRQLTEEMRYSRDKSFNTWSIAVGYGTLVMYNDLTSYSAIPDKDWKFGPMVKLSKQIHPAWAFDLQVLNSDFKSGNHAYYSAGNLFDYSINAVTYINQWFAYPGPMRDKWNLYLKIGVGVTSYRTRIHYTDTDEVVHYRDWAPGNADAGYLVLGYDPQDPYKKTARVNELVVPISLGLQYRLNKSFDIGFETSMRWSIEDKLDQVLVGSNNDKYWYTNLHLAYKIGKKDKRHSRWTYRGYGFNVFDKPKKDPLADEVAALEDELKQMQANKIIKTDSVTIMHHALRIYGSSHMVSVYFDSSDSKLDTKDQVALATIGLYMAKNPDSTVDIYAYDDSQVNPSDNLNVSKIRCEKVLEYFVKDLGIDKNRFRLDPKGEDDLLLSKDKAKNNSIQIINRRADVVVFRP